MPKRLITLVVALVFAFAFAGCSSGEASSSDAAGGSGSSAESSAPSLFVSNAWPNNEITKGVPAPQLSVDAKSADTGGNPIVVSYGNVPADEVESYVTQLKSAGFVHDAKEERTADMYSYSALNNEDILESKSAILAYESTGGLYIAIADYTLE